MQNFKVIYKVKDVKWIIQERIIQANSPEDAIKRMDMWPPLIIKVEKI
jgi:hypothetical protein